PPVKTPRGSLSGRVTIKDKPAPGVVVGLRKSALENSYDPFDRAVTDADGIYRITNIPPGSYVVTVAAPAYVPTNSSDRKPVVIGEDENVGDVNFSLVRGGVITGKVTDSEGHPVVLHQVELYNPGEVERVQGGQLPYPSMTTQTDDRGVYRLFGVVPGRYSVAAGRGNEGGYFGYSPSEVNYKQAFYADPAKGDVIEVSEGSEAKDIDITLGRAVQTFSVSGRIINGETNTPVPGQRFNLQRVLGNRMEYVSAVAVSNARGDFIMEGLIAGKYSTVVHPREGSDLRAEVTTFELIDRDVSGVTIKLTRGASISGFVVLETEDKSARGRLPEMLLRGFVPVGPDGGSSPAVSSQIAADGSFRLGGLAGGFANISLSAKGGMYPPNGFSILRIERDGMPVPRFELKDAEQVTGVKIFVGYGTATIRGVVKIENGSLSSNGRIYVQLTKPGEENSYFRWIMVDDRGNFLVEGVPPGQYDVNVSVMDGKVRKSVKQTVTVTDGVVTDVRIPVDVATPANP
ncbi:MAG TPA: carboxypeptidase-like regulatory domain-containing protein, partial [Pyrinomonadaceae bacterium]|nr:carboxypeptidase-like regulatory domain-containing protein [Pyrinomonadaceae bacterium]